MLSFKIVKVGIPPSSIGRQRTPQKNTVGIRSGENGHGQCCVQDALCEEVIVRRVVTLKKVYAFAEEELLLNRVVCCTEISSLKPSVTVDMLY
ncbi:hypothetical protein AVEN_215531-1 [Araneus ventricosus]|uniref:Uncharacterized protein n=1 Tax=Araneus ventricosus TaxID=182803 RepID=A0A4Y2BEY5_ARAVE|nr:hypothetical protein AVEN_215531-1 [Araneus ventricosus]